MSKLLVLLLVANVAALLGMFVFYRRVRAAQRKRRVEAPNSQYKSPYVVDLEARERWESLALDRLHELNREEMEKLLVKVREHGVRSLAVAERAFLDRMVEAEARVSARGGKTLADPSGRQPLPGT